MFVLAAEGFLTGTTGYWADKDENILGSEIIELDSSQLEGALGGARLNLSFCEDGINLCSGGQQIILTDNIFKTYVTGIDMGCPEAGYEIYFEVYEKDSSVGEIGEDGTDDPIRVGASRLNGIVRTTAPNCLSSVAIAPWAISVGDITNAGTETDGIYEFYYKAITIEGWEKDYNDTILNINITSQNNNLTVNLSSAWYGFDYIPISGTVQFDSSDLSSPTPSVDNSVYFEITGFPTTLKGQVVDIEIYENDSVDGLLDDEIRTASTDVGVLKGTIDETGKTKVLWKLTEEDIIAAETEDTYEFYAKINLLSDEISFKDNPVFIEITDVPTSYLDNALAEWRDLLGLQKETAITYKSTATNIVSLYAWNIGATEGTEVTIQVYEDDAIGRDNIRTIATENPLTGTVNAAGVLFVLWTISEEDVGNSGAGGTESNPWEYYFKLNISDEEKEFDTEILEVRNTSAIVPGECVNVNICADYNTAGDCSEDECNVTIDILGVNCSAEDISCYCAWNETEGCAAQWGVTAPNGTNGTGVIVIGSCALDENAGEDNCDDGFLSYSWMANWNWDGGNQYATQELCLSATGGSPGDCVQDPTTLLWHYDPESRNALCVGGENTLACPNQVQLSFGNWLNWVIAVIIILVIYYFVALYRKKHKKSKAKKKK